MGDKKSFKKEKWKEYSTSKLMEILPEYFVNLGDMEHTAYLNWRFDCGQDIEIGFYEMAKAYLNSAIILIDECLENNYDKKADIWIFPILFNVVHGIEIFLKAFNSQIKILGKLEKIEYQESKIEGSHNIKQLCEVAISLIKISSQKELLDEFKFIKNFIKILYKNTDDMTFARYPINNKGKDHFYVGKRKNITIDLNVLRIWVCKISDILDNCSWYVDFQIDSLKEDIYKMQQEFDDFY